MVGILLITHDQLGEALIQCASHVLGRRPDALAALPVAANQCPSDLVDAARSLIHEIDDGDGVLILTDIFGASPANLACRLLAPGHVEAVAGVNVPMLVRALSYRDRGMDMLLKRVVGGGCEGVFQIEADPVRGPQVAHSAANEGLPALKPH
ncbi:MAG: PTS fructose transporter subunit IIA [Burkholderiales bacterium]|nr:PTS fructose transporter subunit IIA [Pseudomonadota bacterium]MCC7068009.1 PTS fructose transporter subunit IIA [Burkholderiales bacterium]